MKWLSGDYQVISEAVWNKTKPFSLALDSIPGSDHGKVRSQQLLLQACLWEYDSCILLLLDMKSWDTSKSTSVILGIQNLHCGVAWQAAAPRDYALFSARRKEILPQTPIRPGHLEPGSWFGAKIQVAPRDKMKHIKIYIIYIYTFKII